MHLCIRRVSFAAALFWLGGLALGASSPPSLQAQPTVPSELPQHIFQDVLVAPGPELGMPGVVVTQGGDPPSPQAVALAFAQRQQAGQLAAGPTLTWAVQSSAPLDPAVTVVRLTQAKDAIPILGAGLVVQVADGLVRSAAGVFIPSVAATTTPGLSATTAVGRARQLLVQDAAAATSPGVTDTSALADVRLVEQALVFFNPTLFDRGPGPTVLAYRLVLAPADDRTPQVIVLDAQTGKRLLQYANRPSEGGRVVRDARGAYTIQGALCATEQGPVGTPSDDCRAAFTAMGEVADYFRTTHGRNSYDDAGATMTSIVRYGSDTNAFWDSSYRIAAFGPGFATRDVVAHEWTHAVTQFTAGLLYRSQSGAINESISDIFAAMIDRTNWLIGEDTPQGAIRDMAAPPIYDQADTVGNYRCRDSDNGGVHANSGIANKLAYLMADGGSFNGRTVSALGRAATERIFYRALTGGLFASATFLDLQHALLSAAAALYGPDSLQTTATQQATLAVELDQPLPCGDTGTSDAFEPDNRAAQAQPITPDAPPQSHTFHSGGDADWVRFSAVAGQTYAITTSDLELNADTVLTLFASDSTTVIATNDDRSYRILASRIVWTATSSTTVFVQATNYYMRGIPKTGYQLRVALITPTATPDTFEIDNTQATARPIRVGDEVQEHTFHVEGDVDWVTFSAVAGRIYMLEAFALFTTSNPLLAIFQPDGTQLDAVDGSDTEAVQLYWTAPETGMVAVRITDDRSITGSTASYRLHVIDVTTMGDSFEPDNDWPHARPIDANGQGQRHAFYPPGDEDWVSFSATAGMTYRIETSALDSGIDTVIGLYDTAGTSLIAHDDDSGPGLSSMLVWRAPQSGTYFIRVTNYRTSISGASRHGYTVTVADSLYRTRLFFPVVGQ